MGRVDHRHADDLLRVLLHPPPDDLVPLVRVGAHRPAPAHHRHPVYTAPTVHLQHPLDISPVHDVVDAGPFSPFVQHVRVGIEDEDRLGTPLPRVDYAPILRPPRLDLFLRPLPFKQTAQIPSGDAPLRLFRDLRVVDKGPPCSRRLLRSPCAKKQALVSKVGYVALQPPIDLVPRELDMEVIVQFHQPVDVTLLRPDVVGDQHRQPRVAGQKVVIKSEHILPRRPTGFQQDQHLRLLQDLEGLPHHLVVQGVVAGHRPHCPHLCRLHGVQQFISGPVEIRRSQRQQAPDPEQPSLCLFQLLLEPGVAVRRIVGMGHAVADQRAGDFGQVHIFYQVLGRPARASVFIGTLAYFGMAVEV